MVRFVSDRREMPAGLARAYLLVLAPAAFLAPLPLLWTEGAGQTARQWLPARRLTYELTRGHHPN